MSKATKNTVTKTEAAKTTNPFREGGNYHACVNGLLSLGMNKMHSFDAIVKAVREAMFSNWKAFAAKANRNDETGKDANARVIQNVSVIARKDYGQPLQEIGLHVVFDGRSKTAGLFKIGQGPAVKAKAEKTPASKPKAKAKSGKADPTVCGRCQQPLKMFKDKGETEAKLTCPDCGWRPGDKKGVVSPKQIALAASATKADPNPKAKPKTAQKAK